MQITALAASTHTTTTQLQLVSQVKDAVIGSSIVALVVLAQRGKKRPELRNSALVTLAQRGKRRPKQTLQRIVLPPPEPQLQLVSEVFADNISSCHTTQPQLQLVSQVKLVICMQRCGHRSSLQCGKTCQADDTVIRNGLAQRAKSPISVTLRAVNIFGKTLRR